MYVSGYSSSSTRVTGLVSGMDIDQTVLDLMKVEQIPLERTYQKKQLSEWKMESYRSITNVLRGFNDKFFDILKPSNYMLSGTSYKKFSATTSNSSVVSVSANSDASVGNHTITVENLATCAERQSAGKITKDIIGTNSVDFEAANLSNRINASDSLEKISEKMETPIAFNEDGKVALQINGQEFEFDMQFNIC